MKITLSFDTPTDLAIFCETLNQAKEDVLDAKEMTATDPTIDQMDDLLDSNQLYNQHLDVLNGCLEQIAKECDDQFSGRRSRRNVVSALRERLQQNARVRKARRRSSGVGRSIDSTHHA